MWLALSFVHHTLNWWLIVNITCSFSSDSTRNNLFQNSSETQQIFQKFGRRRLLRKAIPKTTSKGLLKKYTDAKEWCENGAKNGFKAGRLFEPKSQSFNDKVIAKSKIVHKIAIESGQQKSK